MVKEETKQQYEVFTTISIPVSVSISANSLEEAEQLASLQLDQETIQQIMMTFITLNGKVIQPKVHNWETNGYEVVEK